MVINIFNNFNVFLNIKLFDFLRIKLFWIWNEVNVYIKKNINIGL